MIGQRVEMYPPTRILFAALLIVAVGLSACGQSTSEPVEKLTVGVFKGVFSSLIYIAESQGYFPNVTVQTGVGSGWARVC